MNTSLPEDFIRLRQPLLGDEWNDFLGSYDAPKSYGLRRNLLKASVTLPFALHQVPWAKEGFYANPEERPGKHPLHEAGAYYIQEPSAMSVVSLLDPQPGEVICDLCAAPGGKSTQIAGRLQGKGMLVSNEIIPSRAKILSQNIERLGIPNALVCNEPPDRMASAFPLCFDRIVVDAPCSGEGMFRKDDTALAEWSPENVRICSERQQMILNHADNMLKPGGTLVYSTCTFAPEENETMIAWFLATHPDYTVEDWKTSTIGKMVSNFQDNAGLCDGRADWVDWNMVFASGSNAEQMHRISNEIGKTLRLWPHKLKGEGHFVAKLHKAGTPLSGSDAIATSGKKKKDRSGRSGANSRLTKDILSVYEDFFNKHLLDSSDAVLKTGQLLQKEHLTLFGDELYLLPEQAPPLNGIKVLRAGLHVGTCKKNRLEPSYALAKVLNRSQSRNYHDCQKEEAIRYLKGETISCDTTLKGWTLVCYQNCPLGWGKAQNGILKNHFPKGLRWN